MNMHANLPAGAEADRGFDPARFDRECDRLSQAVDAVQFERLRWARCEGPMLTTLVALAQGALEGRGEFELCEEGATADRKRFVLKIHGFRVMGLALWLSAQEGAAWAHVDVEAIARSQYQVAAGVPVSAVFGAVDAAWMAAALETVFRRVAA